MTTIERRVLDEAFTLSVMNFRCKVTEEGPIEAEAQSQFQDLLQHATEKEHWTVYWAQSVGQTHTAILITGKTHR